MDGIKFILTVALGDHDVAEVFGLLNLQLLKANHFQQGEKGGNHFVATGGVGKQFGKTKTRLGGDAFAEHVDLVRHREVLILDMPHIGSASLNALDHVVHRID